MKFEEQLNYYVSMAESMLGALLTQADAPALLQESMEYSLLSGGKRLRPVLCMATCELLGGSAPDAVKAACAIEMVHAYSLIHDDLPAMDNDDFRRGLPSNHKKFGEANAILAGDGLLTMAFFVLSQVENEGRKVVQTVARGAMDMVCGQSIDINESDNPGVMFELMAKKTGALIRAAVLAGAYCSGSQETGKWIGPLTVFAEKFGLLFQITDDILDSRQDEKEEGMSFVSLYGLQPARDEAKRVADAAVQALAEVPGDVSFLTELTQRMLTRTR